VTLFLAIMIAVGSFSGSNIFVVKAEYPHGAISITFDDNTRNQYTNAFPQMQARGILGTFYVVTDQISDFSGDDYFMSIAELQTLQAYGNEIASHSKSHRHLTSLSDAEIHEECAVSQQILQSYGFPAVNFAYPYGDHDERVSAIADDYYNSARGTYGDLRIMEFPVTQFDVPGFSREGTPEVLSQLMDAVDQIYLTNGWAIFYFHNVIDGAYNQEYTISTEHFSAFLDYVVLMGVETITVQQGLSYGSNPVVSISPTSVTMMVGQSQLFTAAISGGAPPFTYQWYLNGSAVPGSNSATWNFTPTEPGHYNVYVIATDINNFATQSNVVNDIIVYTQLSVTISPTSIKMTTGESQQFTSAVTGGATPYTYQWYLNASQVAGATEPTYTFTPSSAGNCSIHLVVTSDNLGSVQSNIATAEVNSPLVVSISPSNVKLYFGQSSTFHASVSGGAGPYSYQWHLNGSAVSGATSATWTFTPKANGNYIVYVNVTDSLNYEAQSNIVSDIQVYSVYLSLNVEPKKPTYEKQQQVTFSVTIFNQLNPALDTSLILTVTGPNGYHLCHPFPISVKANSAQEHSLSWVVPEAPGTYIAEVQLAPSSLTAYDTVWLKIS